MLATGEENGLEIAAIAMNAALGNPATLATVIVAHPP